MRETPKSITDWATNTFGHTPTVQVAARMNVEVAELLEAVAGNGSPLDILEECADVYIMLAQIFETTAPGQDFQEWVNNKMSINRGRSWGRSPSGRVQHL